MLHGVVLLITVYVRSLKLQLDRLSINSISAIEGKIVDCV